jgi:hypothetical protein
MAYDTYQITRDVHLVPISGDIIGNLSLGAGVIMSDPLQPILAPRSPFLNDPRDEATEAPDNQEIDLPTILGSTTSYIETNDTYQRAMALYANMKASFGFGSASAALSYTRDVEKTSDIIIALIEQSITGPELPERNIRWSAAPSSEGISDNDERLRQFVADYGSHYVQVIEYGYRVAVYGAYATSSDVERREFHAAFKAAFTGGGAGGGGGATDTQTTMLKSSNLKAEVSAGDLRPAHSVVLTGFEQIRQFLDDIKSGKIAVYRGPIKMLAKNYWHTLLTYPQTRALLSPSDGQPAQAPFGVPGGTIIMWWPKEGDLRRSDAGVDILVPDGWAIAAGQDGLPDLSEHFILGATSYAEVGVTGGAPSHIHTGSTDLPAQGEWTFESGDKFSHMRLNGQQHYHSFTTAASSNVPPNVKMLYLIKL